MKDINREAIMELAIKGEITPAEISHMTEAYNTLNSRLIDVITSGVYGGVSQAEFNLMHVKLTAIGDFIKSLDGLTWEEVVEQVL